MDIFAPAVVSWFIFVEMDTDEDVLRVRTCKCQDVTTFGLLHPWDNPTPSSERLRICQTCTKTIPVDL